MLLFIPRPPPRVRLPLPAPLASAARAAIVVPPASGGGAAIDDAPTASATLQYGLSLHSFSGLFLGFETEIAIEDAYTPLRSET